MHISRLSILVLLMVAGTLQAQELNSFRKKFLEETMRENTRLPLTPALREAAAREARERSLQAKPNNGEAAALSSEASGITKSSEDWVESIVSEDLYPESEVHAVMNPVDPRNFIVSPIRQQVYQGQIANLSCPLYYTLDDGAGWQLSPFETSPADPDGMAMGGGDPVLVADEDGTLYFSWLAFYFPSSFDRLISELYWVYSTDGGATWVRPEKDVIATAFMTLTSTVQNFVDKQWLAVDRSTTAYRGTLYAGHLRVRNDLMHIAVHRKAPGAVQFDTEEVFVSPDSLSVVQFTNIDVDPSGGVHVTWFGSADENHFSLWHALSTDGGRTFPTVTKISDIIFPKFSIEDRLGEIPGILNERMYPSPQSCTERGANPGHVYITWAAKGISRMEGNGTDIYFARSTDNGRTWEPPRIINDDAKGIVRDQFHPSIAVNAQGVLAITWYDRREDDQNSSARYYIAVSRDGGANFLGNKPVAAMPMDMWKAGEDNGGFGIGEYTQVIVTDTEVRPFWSDGRSNDGNIDIYCARLGISTLEVTEMSPLAASFRILDAYPSPVHDLLRLRVAFDAAMETRISICDLLGRRLKESGAWYQAGTHELAFDMSALPAGSYQVVLKTSGGIATRLVRILR